MTSATVLALELRPPPRRHEPRSSSTVAGDSAVAPDESTFDTVAPQTLRTAASSALLRAPSIRHMLEWGTASSRRCCFRSCSFPSQPRPSFPGDYWIQDALLRNLIQWSHGRITSVVRPSAGGSAVLAPRRRFGSERSAADDFYGYRVRACSALLALWRDVLKLTMIRACLHSAAVITTNLPPSQFLILLQLLMHEMPQDLTSSSSQLCTPPRGKCTRGRRRHRRRSPPSLFRQVPSWTPQTVSKEKKKGPSKPVQMIHRV